MKNTKGQAAMEFLMTYGWAILAAIVVIAVLAIYFRPGNIVGQVATFSPPLTALSQSLTASDDTMIVEVRNSGAESMSVSAFTTTITSPTGGACTPAFNTVADGSGANQAAPFSWSPGVTLFLRCDLGAGTGDLEEGKQFGADVTVTYTSGAGSIPKTATGTVSGRINA